MSNEELAKYLNKRVKIMDNLGEERFGKIYYSNKWKQLLFRQDLKNGLRGNWTADDILLITEMEEPPNPLELQNALLKAENDRLRKALEEIQVTSYKRNPNFRLYDIRNIVDNALNQKP